MTIEDLYDAIPNKEDVDVIFINAVFARLTNLKEMTQDMPTQPVTSEETTREGNIKTVKNPWWDVWRNEIAGCSQNLSELNLTPKSRKALFAKINTGGVPDLGS